MGFMCISLYGGEEWEGKGREGKGEGEIGVFRREGWDSGGGRRKDGGWRRRKKGTRKKGRRKRRRVKRKRKEVPTPASRKLENINRRQVRITKVKSNPAERS